MCTIIAKDYFIGKNFDSIVNAGMLFTNKRGLIKKASVFPPERPLEWVSAYGSITFSQSGKEYPVGGVNEKGLVVEQATLPGTQYPEHQGKPLASSLETTQFLLDTCGSVEQALSSLEQYAIIKTSWPVHFAIFDSNGRTAIVEYLQGIKKVIEGTMETARLLTNTEFRQEEFETEFRSEADMFFELEKAVRPDTVWSNVYDLKAGKLYLRRSIGAKPFTIDLNLFDFSPRSKSRMQNIVEEDSEFRPYTEKANRHLIDGFYNHPVINQIMMLPDTEAMIDYIADQSKSYDKMNEIVLRFLDEEKISQLPVKGTHRLAVLKYLASKFDTGKEYTEAEVNAIINEWHTFGDYFILRRELIDSGLLKRMPNGSKYWRELG